ncbi:nucleoside triphosphate pyrophosphohydrolase [Patescibacteria group bacterium]|nr:nucleoside triphosphate pyrophosphohydrolase [Patescibacteria group bacterium]
MPKLVRDNIPDIITAKGEHFVSHVADDAEYWQRLKEKLAEEVGEFQKDENESELADILEVIDAIVAYKKFDQASIAVVKAKKFAERGGFAKRIVLDEH